MTATEISLGRLIIQGPRDIESLAEYIVAQNLPRACQFTTSQLIEGSLVDAGQVHIITSFLLQRADAIGTIAKTVSIPLPQALRDETGLPIDILATLARVSRQRFHQWLRGEGVNVENERRLSALLRALRAISALRSDLRSFLLMRTPLGTPLELLAHGEEAAALGLARFAETVRSTKGLKKIKGIPRRMIDARSASYQRYNSSAVANDGASLADHDAEVISFGTLSVQP